MSKTQKKELYFRPIRIREVCLNKKTFILAHVYTGGLGIEERLQEIFIFSPVSRREGESINLK